MRIDAEVDAVSDCVDDRLEGVVVEGLNAAARVADEVMMMFAVGMSRFEASDTITGVDAGDERQAVEQLERAVDAGDAGRSTSGRDLSVDLLRTSAAVLGGKRGDHELACAAHTRALSGECRARVRLPDGGGGVVVMWRRCRHWLQSI